MALVLIDTCIWVPFFNRPQSAEKKALDALHLAAARVSGESEIVAIDKRLRDAAAMLGFALFPT